MKSIYVIVKSLMVYRQTRFHKDSDENEFKNNFYFICECHKRSTYKNKTFIESFIFKKKITNLSSSGNGWSVGPASCVTVKQSSTGRQGILPLIQGPVNSLSYGGILLPLIWKINYVNMQHNYVDMHVINFCQKLFFSTGKFFY